MKSEQDPLGLSAEAALSEASMKLGNSSGRIEAYMDSSETVRASIPKILELISNPDESIKVMNALMQLVLDIIAKR